MTLSLSFVAGGLLMLPAVLATSSSPYEWYWGREDCKGNMTEACLGTEVWCFMKTLKGEYGSTESCYGFRRQMEWFDPGGHDDCDDDDEDDESEKCLGTEAFCGLIDSSWDRDRCIGARVKTPWLDAQPDACSTEGPMTELCMGTKAWCQRDDAWKIYSSEEICLNHRSKSVASSSTSSNETDERLPSVPALGDRVSCGKDPYSEACMGSEMYCLGKSSQQLRDGCFRERKPLRYHHRYSAECKDAKGDRSEACVGSVAWCQHDDRIKLWGSAEDCLAFRTEPPKLMPMHYKSHDSECKGKVEEEECTGTEFFCMRFPGRTQRKQCFESREAHPFLAANSVGCPGRGVEDERCMGTTAWCKDLFRKKHYEDADECLQVRGFMYDDLKLIAKKWLDEGYRSEILTQGKILGRASFFIELGQLRHTNETAQQLRERVRYTLSRFVQKLWRDARRTAEKGVHAFVDEKGL
ncbi:hypothetical protein CP532_1760 [Ophiocordyceps camponoti-leonardi (nom. inval.)]|nr:hypothetical protein CP532_1760 [Ophiocordyceps camponoti-leonardi (nom. inval.)]